MRGEVFPRRVCEKGPEHSDHWPTVQLAFVAQQRCRGRTPRAALARYVLLQGCTLQGMRVSGRGPLHTLNDAMSTTTARACARAPQRTPQIALARAVARAPRAAEAPRGVAQGALVHLIGVQEG